MYLVLRHTSNNNILWIYLSLVIGSGLQALQGNLQLWGYFPSNHSFFRVTGGFFNPGPYAGYLASVFTIALGFCLFQTGSPAEVNKQKWSKLIILIKPLIVTTLVLMALALAATHSRAALLALLVSVGYMIIYVYKYEVNAFFKKFSNSTVKKLGLTVFGITLCCGLLISLFYLKKDSANGRLFIWQIGTSMIKDKPILGFGFDQFKAHYMNYQAAFFQQNPHSPKGTVAGDTNYAFNEPLQVTIESGIVGLLILASFFILCLKSKISNEKIGNASDLRPRTGKGLQNKCILFVSAKAGIINILVFSLFSYPGQILPIKITLVLYLATVANLSKREFILFSPPTQRFFRLLNLSGKIVLIATVTFLIFNSWKKLTSTLLAYHCWKSAYDYYQFGVYDASVREYKKALPVLKANGNFLTNYGKALALSGKYIEAKIILKKAENHYPNTILYITLGDCYKSLGQYTQAEQAYLQSWHMNPSRFYPLYLLVKLYAQCGQKEKATTVANELLNKEIKVHSKAIQEMKEELRKLITQGRNK
ncbi:O-antigen ligase family protein [Desertivirga xinjiangensis]|uniref:O-antigen ligase family protein n=1 Tax=Desertivirga xinjiangensis TaxID=539206 RepID=UPI00210CAF06|nr:O-antigen ligase family protein [Pedobacter xinjiangensis]